MDFSKLTPNTKTAPKEILSILKKAGILIAQSSVEKAKRSSGVSFVPIHLTVSSGQTLEIRVKNTGDIYQVLMNGKILPIKEQDNEINAVAEIAKALSANQTKFQAALARKVAKLPTGLKSTAKRQEEVLQEELDELNRLIAEAESRLGITP